MWTTKMVVLKALTFGQTACLHEIKKVNPQTTYYPLNWILVGLERVVGVMSISQVVCQIPLLAIEAANENVGKHDKSGSHGRAMN